MTTELHGTIALACRILANEGLSRVSFGHVSARTEPNGEVIAMKGRSSSDAGLQFSTSNDIVELTVDGTILNPGPVSPPREFPLHLEIFKARPDVQSVVHVHPRHVVALSAVGLDLLPVYGAYDPDGLRIARGDVGYFRSSKLIDSTETGVELVAALADHSTCVLDGHGIATVGSSVEAAVLNAIAIEELAYMTWLAACAGTPRPISEEDQRRFDPPAAPRTAGEAMTAMSAPLAWQHYVERDRVARR